MKGRWLGVTIDSVDVERATTFWTGLLGLHADRSRPGWVYLTSAEGGPRVVLQPVAEAHVGKVPTHLDVEVDDLDEATERVLRLGGSLTGERHDFPEGGVVVARDPDGHELCLVCFRPSTAG